MAWAMNSPCFRILSAVSLAGAPPSVMAQDSIATSLPVQKARTNLSLFVGSSDYPPAALEARQEGTVVFELDVTPFVRVSECRVTASSGVPALDERTCTILRERARFVPARDAANRPIADVLRSRLGWRIPEDLPAVQAKPKPRTFYIQPGDYPSRLIGQEIQGSVAFELEISPEGRAVHCTILGSEVNDELEKITCEILKERSRFEPARDSSGKAVSDTHGHTFHWHIAQ